MWRLIRPPLHSERAGALVFSSQLIVSRIWVDLGVAKRGRHPRHLSCIDVRIVDFFNFTTLWTITVIHFDTLGLRSTYFVLLTHAAESYVCLIANALYELLFQRLLLIQGVLLLPQRARIHWLGSCLRGGGYLQVYQALGEHLSSQGLR
jgi:hypothetical protein